MFRREITIILKVEQACYCAVYTCNFEVLTEGLLKVVRNLISSINTTVTIQPTYTLHSRCKTLIESET